MNSRLLRIMGIVLILVMATTIFAAPILASGEVKGDVDIKGTIAKILYPDGKTLLKVDFGGPHPIGVWVTDDTDIDGELVLYGKVWLKAEFMDNKLVATEIEVLDTLEMGSIYGELDITGTISKILYPDGKTVLVIDFGGMHPIKVLVTDETDIDAEGKLMVGDMVRVRAEFVKTCLTATDITVLD